MEQWRDVVGYEGLYCVSDLGRVWSEPRHSGGQTQGRRYRDGRILTPLVAPRGYRKYALSRDGVQRQHSAHVLVLTAFVGPPPPGMECAHEDGNPANNAIGNLSWKTHGDNLRDRVRHGTDPHASRTTCPRGHGYHPGNLRRGSAARQCLACSKAHNRLCRGRVCNHSSPEFIFASQWYYDNPARRWTSNRAG